ncbi:MAG: glycosyltransferase family 2 protein [Cyanobacteriota bacterium]
MNQPIFSVCIITFRRPALLKQCLDRLAPERQVLPSHLYEVIVSDDCPDASARPTVQEFSFARWIQGPSQGIAANRNHVARASLADWIVFIDDDELPSPDWLAQIYELVRSGSWDVIEGRVEPIDYPDSILWYAPMVRSAGMFCTANLAIKREQFFSVGGFDERLRTSHEDIELGQRIKAAGLRSCFLESACVLHPARRISFSQVLKRTIQQQCQSYLLPNRKNKTGWRSSPTIVVWSLKYLVRTFRMQTSVEGFSRWRSLLMGAVIRTFCCPFACIRIICS